MTKFDERIESREEPMLLIRVHIGEEIRIGDDIVVVVSRIHGNRVASIGIKAPKEIPVHRAEYLEKLRRQSDGVDNG